MSIETVPYSDQMEKALLVGLLSDPSLIPRITVELEEKDFFREYHKEIYRVITSTLDISNVDSITVEDVLTGQTKEYFTELVKSSDSILPSLTNIKVYAQTIKDKSRLRAGINLGREITAICYEPNVTATEALQKLEDMYAKFLQDRVVDDKSVDTKKAFAEFLADLEHKIEEVGLKTGFFGIDMIIQKLEGLVVLAARPSLGKTALSIQIMRNVAETRPVLMFSLEQSRDQIFERMLAAESLVKLEDIRSGAYLAEDDLIAKIEEASVRIDALTKNLHIDDTPSVATTYITSVARQKHYEWGDIGLIVVDYLHIMKLNEGSKVDALGDAVKELRALGKELGCPVLLLSQLSRQQDNFTDENKTKRHRRPELTDLRSSGEIEQSADIVMFLYKESYYEAFSSPAEDIVEIIVRKSRNGPTGIGTLRWKARFTRFEDLEDAKTLW